MSETKFTPGPWKAVQEAADKVELIVVARGNVSKYASVAAVHGRCGEQQANAYLIAAAPAMYEALEGLMLVLKGVTLPTAVQSYAEAALKKARGAQ